jgi:hypothetical protein
LADKLTCTSTDVDSRLVAPLFKCLYRHFYSTQIGLDWMIVLL